MSRQSTMFSNSKVMVSELGHTMLVLFMSRFMNIYHGKPWTCMVLPLLVQALVQPNLKVNDMFLLKYRDKVMSQFCLYIMTELMKSEDGVIRTVKIRLRNKKAYGLKLPPLEDMEVVV